MEEQVYYYLINGKPQASDTELTNYSNAVAITKEQFWEKWQEIDDKVQRLAVIKGLLASYDYKTSKYADGEYTDEQWAEIVAQRKAWRAEIRELEGE